jgi:hypothetical protein
VSVAVILNLRMIDDLLTGCRRLVSLLMYESTFFHLAVCQSLPVISERAALRNCWVAILTTSQAH